MLFSLRVAGVHICRRVRVFLIVTRRVLPDGAAGRPWFHTAVVGEPSGSAWK